MSTRTSAIILSCDYAAGHVPRRFQYLFADKTEVLQSSQAYDRGLRPVARHLAALLNCPWERNGISRLLIDTKLSRRHVLFSPFTHALEEPDKQHLIATYYIPYRYRVFKRIQQQIAEGHQVLHLALSSFPKEKKGEPINVDIDIAYDPHRLAEKELAARWLESLHAQTDWHIRRNFPLRGCADGITTWLRHRFTAEDYLGLGVAFNEHLLDTDSPDTTFRISEILAEMFQTGFATESTDLAAPIEL